LTKTLASIIGQAKLRIYDKTFDINHDVAEPVVFYPSDSSTLPTTPHTLFIVFPNMNNLIIECKLFGPIIESKLHGKEF
jgi:hypothetical protein